MEDVVTFLGNPLVSSALTFLGTLLGAWLKRAVDLRQKQLELEALKITTQIEIVSQQRKRMTGNATPTSTKLAIAKDHLAKTHPTLRAIDAAKVVETVLPHTREVVREVNAKVSQIPHGPGSSGEHVIIIPPHDPPPLQRPSGEHPTFGRVGIAEPKPFDVPKQPATLNLDAIRDAHEVDDDA